MTEEYFNYINLVLLFWLSKENTAVWIIPAGQSSNFPRHPKVRCVVEPSTEAGRAISLAKTTMCGSCSTVWNIYHNLKICKQCQKYKQVYYSGDWLTTPGVTRLWLNNEAAVRVFDGGPTACFLPRGPLSGVHGHATVKQWAVKEAE